MTVPTPAPSGSAFEIHGCLGRGGFGEVYHATMSTSSGVRRVVAVKTLRADVDPNGDAVRRLRDEARLVAAIRHPAVVRVHDLVMLDGRVALVTEYVDGQDLAVLAGAGVLPLRPLVAVVGEVASCLEVVFWSQAPDGESLLQIVHRDVKPANIRVGRHAEVKLLDFGIARASMEREAETQTNVALGSLSFMAPERFRTDRVESPSDVYALGCTLFVCLTRRGMFEDASPQTVWKTMLDPARCAAHLESRLAQLPADLPEGLRTLLRRMLAVDAASRPSAGEVAKACEALEDEIPGPSLKRWCQDRAWPDLRYVEGSIQAGGRELTELSVPPTVPDPPVKSMLSLPPTRFDPGEFAPSGPPAPVVDVAIVRHHDLEELAERDAPSPSPAVWASAGFVILSLAVAAALYWGYQGS